MSAPLSAPLPLPTVAPTMPHDTDLQPSLDLVPASALSDAEGEPAPSVRPAAPRGNEPTRSTRITKLGDRTLVPRHFLDSAYDAENAQRKLKRVEQGDLFLDEDVRPILVQAAKEEMLAGASSQLANLPAPEIRALVGALRALSSPGDAGKAFAFQAVELPAAMMYEACGVDPHSGRATLAQLGAFETLSERTMRLVMTYQVADEGTGKLTGQVAAYPFRGHFVSIAPVWIDPEPDQRDKRRYGTEKRKTKRQTRTAREIVAEWNARQDRRAGPKPPPSDLAPWDGPMPDRYMVSVPYEMAQIWSALALNGDVLTRLDIGAKLARGLRESFTSLDWRLLIEVTSRVQRHQLSEDGKSLQSYVDRDKLLLDFYGKQAVAKAREEGYYKRVYVGQYERAVRVLKEGELARRTKSGHPARRGGERDVFVLDSEVLMGTGTSARVEAAKQRLTDKIEKALKRKPQAKKPRAKKNVKPASEESQVAA